MDMENKFQELIKASTGKPGSPTEFSELLENAVIKLINQHEFFAHVLMQLRVTPTSKVPVAGVGIRAGAINLYINPHVFCGVTLEDRTELLIHECAHVMLGHLTHRKTDFKNAKAANIAMDAAIHEVCSDIPKAPNLQYAVVTVPKLAAQFKIKLNRDESTDYYYDKLREAVKEQTGLDFDNHEFMEGDGESSDGGADAAKSLTAQILEQAIRKTKEGAGKVPAQAELTLEKLTKHKVNWRAQLRRYIGSSTTDETRLSRNKRNRRHGLERPGKRKKFTPVITLVIDTSGSMGGAPLEQVFAEMIALDKLGYDINIVEADCEITKPPYKLRAKSFTGFTGGGGTAYQPGIDAALRLRSDLIIYMGDGDSSDVPVDPRVPFVWLMVGNGQPPANFGRTIYVECT